MTVLTPAEIQAALANLPEWKVEGGSLVRNFEFEDFRESMSFTQLVAALAERDQHHPDIDIRYNKVRLTLSSHDAGGITQKDIDMVNAIAGVL